MVHIGGWALHCTSQKTRHKKRLLYVWIAGIISQHVIFQPDNDLFLSSTVSYLAYLSNLEGKIIIWCGGYFSGLLMLLCPWLLSLLYNSLRPFFLRMIFFYCISICGNVYWALNNTVRLTTWMKCNDDGEQRAEGEIRLNIKSMFCKSDVFKKSDKGCSLYSDSGLSVSILNNQWAVMMLLHATHDLLLHLLWHHRSLRTQHVV